MAHIKKDGFALYKKYDIVYVNDRGPANGSVQMYARPAVILQNDTGNFYGPTTIVAFLTGRDKRRDLPVHVVLENYNLPKKSTVLLEQIATISKTDIECRIDRLRREDQLKIDTAMLISLGVLDRRG